MAWSPSATSYGLSRGREVLARVDLVRVTDRILNSAGLLLPALLRSLDAIHLATASQLGPDRSQIVTYDDKMLDTSKRLGFKTAAPG
jgi:predicted nucleic acid-binding protein